MANPLVGPDGPDPDDPWSASKDGPAAGKQYDAADDPNDDDDDHHVDDVADDGLDEAGDAEEADEEDDLQGDAPGSVDQSRQATPGGIGDDPAVAKFVHYLKQSAGATPPPPDSEPLEVGDDGTPPLVDLRTCYQLLRDRLRSELIDQHEATDALALAGAIHAMTDRTTPGARLLLIGPTGSGKTTAARILSASLNAPNIYLDANDLTGTGWRGTNIGDVLPQTTMTRHGIAPIIVIDEIHCLRIFQEADGNVITHQRERQTSLMGVVGGTPVRVNERTSWDARFALVICVGSLDGIQTAGRIPTVEELIRYGFVPEMANRLAGEIITFQPPSAAMLRRMLQRMASRTAVREMGLLVGCPVVVADETISLLVSCLHAQAGASRTGPFVLLAAIRRVIRRYLEQPAGAPRQDRLVVYPDDLEARWARPLPPENDPPGPPEAAWR